MICQSTGCSLLHGAKFKVWPQSVHMQRALMRLSMVAIRMATSARGNRLSSRSLCARRLYVPFSACLMSVSLYRHAHCCRLWSPCLRVLWNLSPGQLKMGLGFTATLIGRFHLPGFLTSSSPCGCNFMLSSGSARLHLACVRRSPSSARTRYLHSLKWLICGECGNNGLHLWAILAPLIGQLHLDSRMQLRLWHTWQACWGTRM